MPQSRSKKIAPRESTRPDISRNNFLPDLDDESKLNRFKYHNGTTELGIVMEKVYVSMFYTESTQIIEATRMWWSRLVKQLSMRKVAKS